MRVADYKKAVEYPEGLRALCQLNIEAFYVKLSSDVIPQCPSIAIGHVIKPIPRRESDANSLRTQCSAHSIDHFK